MYRSKQACFHRAKIPKNAYKPPFNLNAAIGVGGVRKKSGPEVLKVIVFF